MNKNQRRNIITRKFLTKFFIILLLLNLVIVSFLSIIFSNTYDIRKYDKRFERFKVYEVFEKDIALGKAQNILSFFESKEELDNVFFNENEVSHLIDVKILLQKSRTVYYVSLFLIFGSLLSLAFLDKKNYFVNLSDTIFSLGLIIIVLIILFLASYYLFGFKIVFEKFHQIFFTGNYAFDPAISNLKKLLPDAFFLDISKTVLFDLITQGILFLTIGFVVKNNLKKNK